MGILMGWKKILLGPCMGTATTMRIMIIAKRSCLSVTWLLNRLKSIRLHGG